MPMEPAVIGCYDSVTIRVPGRTVRNLAAGSLRRLTVRCGGGGVVRRRPPADGVTLNRIADTAFNHGEVVDIAAHLADQIGARMTNSPAMRQAERSDAG